MPESNSQFGAYTTVKFEIFHFNLANIEKKSIIFKNIKGLKLIVDRDK